MKQPRFRKGKKARKNCITFKKSLDTPTFRTPKQQKLYNRYVKTILRFREGKKNVIRMAMAAVAVGIGKSRLQLLIATRGASKLEKAIQIAQISIETAMSVTRAINTPL